MLMDVHLHTIYLLLRVTTLKKQNKKKTEKMWLVGQCLVHWLILIFAILQLKLIFSDE